MSQPSSEAGMDIYVHIENPAILAITSKTVIYICYFSFGTANKSSSKKLILIFKTDHSFFCILSLVFILVSYSALLIW